MKKNKDEYLMLRDEILHSDVVVNNTINFFYIFMASFLAFAITQNDTVFILLSYVIIIPAYLIVHNKMEAMAKIGAYLHVFQEGEKFNWETRNMEYIRKHPGHIAAPNLPFIFVNFSIFILLLLRTQWKSPFFLYEITKVIIGCCLFLGMSLFLLKNKLFKTRDRVTLWEEIKESSEKPDD